MTLFWMDCAEIFHQDGSLRDIYIQQTTIRDWQLFLSYLRASPYALRLLQEGVESPLPANVACLLHDKTHAYTLEIDVDNIKLHCHFFAEAEIELDLDPKEVTSEKHLHSIVTFMSRVGAELHKDVELTAENARDYVWLRYFCRIERVRRLEYP